MLTFTTRGRMVNFSNICYLRQIILIVTFTVRGRMVNFSKICFLIHKIHIVTFKAGYSIMKCLSLMARLYFDQ